MIYLKEYNRELFYEEVPWTIYQNMQSSDITPYLDKIKKWVSNIKMDPRWTKKYDPWGVKLGVPVYSETRLGNIIKNFVIEIKEPMLSPSGHFLGINYYIKIFIKVDDDEWFYVAVEIYNRENSRTLIVRNYKCDQLDGLFQLITDKIESKV